MSHHVRHRPSLPVTIVAAAIALAPLPVMAGPASPSPATHQGITASIQKAVSAEVATSVGSAPSATGAARVAASAQTDLSAPSFFKTPAGIVTLVAIAAGVGYAIYSTSNDRVKSPAR